MKASFLAFTFWSMSNANASFQGLNTNIPQLSPVRETRKASVETILKQLEYVAKGRIRRNANNIVLI